MRTLLITLSATIAAAVPAAAQDGASFARSGVAEHVTIHRGAIHRGDGDRRRHRDRRDRHSGDLYFGYRDYQGDTLWRSGGFNDWWHDRPDRAFPRWVATNSNCERQYWSGGGWRC